MKPRTISTFIVVIVLSFVGVASTIVVPTQPVSEFADTEVSTNIAIRTGRTLSREVEIHIELVGTPTNCLEVAFGRDANANGALDAEEIETAYGYMVRVTRRGAGLPSEWVSCTLDYKFFRMTLR